MSEKFPPLEDEQVAVSESIEETDFLKREAEALGDEFKTEHDTDLLNNSDEEQFSSEQQNQEDQDELAELQAASPALPSQAPQETTNSDAAEIINKWRESRDKQVHERDETLKSQKSGLQEQAIKYIDDFYANYNEKKEQNIKTVSQESEEFLSKRDQFFTQDNTTWDRVLQLINEDDADIVGGRDRSKFKEILQRLKGKVDAPGA
ncbi:hypothetical protein KAFR_0K00920 [Kazachstania africana CBS 2517]|uniref:Clathrin light chain n=1 Tax=Kazachstania africana (strain ATCC 22294 / BCRC 22015 / CBS 2517 / CECT 1963 / NBRC 1671 / NRRL Y-8276) TaxID=1071382 RepID=H2B1E8_KAZAF|nr:hypothetical protein KAFR_0K00920 [Kazachstania africana CBS 2517]CCF60448.1 hypothetical protein KAFR_0K00920 [Kazachstania africana CBS 2517]